MESKMSIGFVDESSFVISQTIGRCLVRPGEVAYLVGHQAQHKEISVTGLYTSGGQFIYKTSSSKKTKDFLSFLYQIRSKTQEKRMLLILDNASIHRSKKVQQYCNKHNVILVFNAPHAPEYNKIEYLWKMFKDIFRRIQRGYEDIRTALKVAASTLRMSIGSIDINSFLNG